MLDNKKKRVHNTSIFHRRIVRTGFGWEQTPLHVSFTVCQAPFGMQPYVHGYRNVGEIAQTIRE
jgi:hypothetical protein